MVVELVLKQQNLIEEHDLLPSLQLLHVDAFCGFAHLQRRGGAAQSVHCQQLSHRSPVSAYLHLCFLSYQGSSVVRGVGPVVGFHHFFGVF